MTDQDGSGPTLVHLTAEEARDTVAAAAQQYFESRRGRVDSFVDRHFSVAGALALHRKALGWDVLRVPTNILLAIPNIALQLSALGAQDTGARQAAAFLRRRRVLLETAVGRELEWLMMTELLELPYEQGEQVSSKDVLAETAALYGSLRHPFRADMIRRRVTMKTQISASGGVGLGRGGRMSRQRKCDTVLRMLRGEDLETLSRALGVTAATLTGWQDTFVAAGEASLATRSTNGEALETERLKAKLGEMLLERELLDAKIAALEDKRPLARRRSRP